MTKQHRTRRVTVAVAAAVGTASAGLVLATPADAASPSYVTLDKGVLTIVADDANNTIAVGRNAPGTININGHTVRVRGVRATVNNVRLIRIFGRGGNDALTINEANGVMPRAELNGESGDDRLTGGSGNDRLTGGLGSDQAFGGAGDDALVWNPGDGSDLNEGGNGFDTVVVNGGSGGEAFVATANGNRVRFDRINPAPFTLDIGSTEKLALNANGGDDSFSASGDLASLISLSVDGGAGNDRLLGGNGADTLAGGDGNDFVDGNGGNDIGVLGSGDDTFQWDPGDGSDTVEGQSGHDTMLFNGSNAAEQMDVSANGSRARFFRNVGNITMDLNGVEQVDTNALGGSDQVTVNDLSGTDVTAVNVNLAGAAGSSAGDALADSVIVNGTNDNDVVTVTGSQADGATVTGLPAAVHVTGTDGASDGLFVETVDGNDIVDAHTLPAGVAALTINGGNGNDLLVGSAGDDRILGDAGDDLIVGGLGQDVLDGGAGNNLVIQ